jgi:hypothetical protein
MTTNQNVVFITSQTHSGNFGGVAGANAFCNSVAAAGGVPGHYAAFLGTSTASPFVNLGTTARGWIRPDGLPFTDTVSGLQTNQTMWYPATLTEAGVATSAVFYTGNNNTLTCSDWTSATTSIAAGGGQGAEGNYFFGIDGFGCTGSPVVCFGTDFSTPVTVTPAAGRHVFSSRSNFTPTGGLAAADTLCQSEATTAGLPNATRFLAALATSTASASSRFNMNGATWVRSDGVLAATTPANFMGGFLVAPPAPDAKGLTQQSIGMLGSSQGLTGPAQSAAENCNNWTSAAATSTFVLYEPIWGGPAFTSPPAFQEFSGDQIACSTAGPILCLEN